MAGADWCDSRYLVGRSVWIRSRHKSKADWALIGIAWHASNFILDPFLLQIAEGEVLQREKTSQALIKWAGWEHRGSHLFFVFVCGIQTLYKTREMTELLIRVLPCACARREGAAAVAAGLGKVPPTPRLPRLFRASWKPRGS